MVCIYVYTSAVCGAIRPIWGVAGEVGVIGAKGVTTDSIAGVVDIVRQLQQ